MDARKVCNSSCVKPKPADWKPSNSVMSRDPGKLFFRNILARILSNLIVKVNIRPVMLVTHEGPPCKKGK